MTRSAVAAVALIAIAATSAHAQVRTGREVFDEVDPYTRGKPEALEKAGYTSFGPFRWGDSHSSVQIEETLGGVPLIWVETEHFRLGSSLETYAVREDQIERKRVREELKRLKKRLPRINAKAWKLDPWLRLHLYALRLEDIYENFVEELEIEHEDFCSVTDSPCPRPYLGLRDKFTVLLLAKESGLARYIKTYLGGEPSTSYRYYFPEVDSFFYGTSFEALKEDYHNDSALHCAVTFGVTRNLTNGFRGYTHRAPLWWSVGSARWFTRQVDPRWQLYTVGQGESGPSEAESDWAPKVKARVKNKYFPSSTEMLGWEDPTKLDFGDHMISWSRVDYIMRSKKASAHKLLMTLMEPVSWDIETGREEVIDKQCAQAFVEGTGMEPEAFDKAWATWVRKTYPK